MPSANNGSLTYDETTETYKFKPQKDFNGVVNIVYTVIDSDGGRLDLSNSFTLTDVNDSPVAVNTPDVFSDLTEDSANPLVIKKAKLLSSYGDVDANSVLDISSFSVDVNSGSVTVDSNGDYIFTPKENFNGLATFTYTVTDGQAQLQQEQFIRITPVNDAPEGLDTALTGVTGEELVLKPGDFGFKDMTDRNSFKAVNLDFSKTTLSAGSDISSVITIDRDLTSDEISNKQVSVNYELLAEGKVKIKAGSVGSTLEVDFYVQDDGGTENNGADTDTTANKLSLYANPPASNDEEVLKIIRVNQAIDDIELRIANENGTDSKAAKTKKAAGSMSSAAKATFIDKYDAGDFDRNPKEARAYIYSNMEDKSQLNTDKEDLEKDKAIKKEELAAAQSSGDEDAIKAAEAAVEALQARLDTLEATLSEYDNLGAEISLLNKLKENGGTVDVDNLLDNLGGFSSGLEKTESGDLKVKVGSAEIELEGSELESVLTTTSTTYQSSLTRGFADDPEAATRAQLTTYAAQQQIFKDNPGAANAKLSSQEDSIDILDPNISAEERTKRQAQLNEVRKDYTEEQLKAANFKDVSGAFMNAGLSMGDLYEVGDPSLIAKTELLVADGTNSATTLLEAKESLNNLTNVPFDYTITAADLVNEATRIKTTFASDVKVKEVDALGTTELSNTNAAYVGALDGNIQGSKGTTFSVDSKTMVFTFNNVEGRTTEVLSYLAGGADVYTTDSEGNRVFSEAAKQIDAGYAEGDIRYLLKIRFLR